MPIIKLFPSTLPGQPIETIEASGTVGQFLAAKYPAYKEGESQPLILKIDGKEIPFKDWDKAEITDNTCLYFHPQGVYPEMINFKSVIGKVFDFAFGWMIPDMPKVGIARSGASIKVANATANQPRLGEVIPDQAGLFRRAPDFLLPPHRYFVNDNEQWIRMLLCVGRGYYDIASSGIKIGGTEIANLGADASYTVYAPGASLAGDTAAEWWHTVPEVGGTSNGTAGLHINNDDIVPFYTTSTSFIFDGLSVTIPAGAGAFPADWVTGMILRIRTVRDYTVELGSGIRCVIKADLDQDFNELQPYVGMPITIWYGPNEGDYIINNYSPRSGGTKAQIRLNYPNGDPVYAFETGYQKMSISHRDSQYEIITSSTSVITVDRVYDDLTVDSGWPGFDYLESTLSWVSLTPTSADFLLWKGPYAACPEGETTDTLEIDIFFPNGIYKTNDNGGINGWTVDLEIQYRDIALAGAWTSVLKTYNYESVDQLGFTETINIGYEIRPEVRVRRNDVEPTQGYAARAEWFALKSKLTIPSSYSGVTTMTMELRSGDRLAALTENQITVECTRKLPVLSGGVWSANTATRSIASYVAYVAKDIGYVDAQLDLVALQTLETLWASRGDYYDWVHDASTVRDTLNQVLQAGYSSLTIAGGKVTPVRDAVRTVLEQMYTPQNMTEPMRRTVSAVRPDDIDGVDVDYIDATTWTRQTVQCRLPGDAGLQVSTVTINGVTSRTKAWRIGMRLRRQAKYRRWRYEFSTELDGLVSNYLSYCYVADDVPGYAKSCLVTGADTVSGGVMLTVTEPITDFSSNSIVSLRDEDGTIDGPYIAEAGATDFQVKAVGLAVAPTIDYAQELTHALIGDSTRYAFEVLITEIKPNGFDSVDLAAVNYDSRVYDDDNNAP